MLFREHIYTFVYVIVFVSEMPVVTEIYPDKPVFLKPVLKTIKRVER